MSPSSGRGRAPNLPTSQKVTVVKVSDLMTQEVRTCRPTDPLSRAAQIMWDEDCGCVPVVDAQDGVLGMITDRDTCMAAYIRGIPLDALTVQEAMSRSPSTCSETSDLQDALHTMEQRRVHRVPVVDSRQRLVGVLSLADVVRTANATKGSERRTLAEEVLVTLSEVSKPRRSATAGSAKLSKPVAARS